MEFLLPYKLTILALGISGLLIWLQLGIVDLLSIRAKHTPGFGYEEDHSNYLFRAHRTFANSNESVGIFVLLVLFAILSSADASWLNGLAAVYLLGRAGHMLSYYFDLRLVRSIAFGISFVSLLGMFIVGLLAWL